MTARSTATAVLARAVQTEPQRTTLSCSLVGTKLRQPAIDTFACPLRTLHGGRDMGQAWLLSARRSLMARVSDGVVFQCRTRRSAPPWLHPAALGSHLPQHYHVDDDGVVCFLRPPVLVLRLLDLLPALEETANPFFLPGCRTAAAPGLDQREARDAGARNRSSSGLLGGPSRGMVVQAIAMTGREMKGAGGREGRETGPFPTREAPAAALFFRGP